MKINLGIDANSDPVFLDPQVRKRTHTHVIGGSGTGKSKALEWMIRQDIHNGHGVCVMDWHGTLFNDVIRWCAHNGVGIHDDFRSVILLDPAHPEHITGFNPFLGEAGDIATQVSRRVTATIKPWGISNTNEMPTFERICRLLYTYAVENHETLPNASHLLDFANRDLRDYAIRHISNSYIRRHWQRMQAIKSFDEWDKNVLSTENRLMRFLGSQTIRRFMGLTTGNINLLEAMNSGKIVLINLADTSALARDEARVFASLFLNQFFEAAMMRAEALQADEEATPFILYLDEFQEYITDDLAAMLDQVRKGGLHLVLAHQHFGHFADNPKLRKSVVTNARIRVVFGGLDYVDSVDLVNEMFLPDLNTRQIKKAYYHTIHLFDEQTRTTTSQTVGSGSAVGTSESVNMTRGSTNTHTATKGSSGGRPVESESPGWIAEAESASSAESIAESDGTAFSNSTVESKFESRSEANSVVFVPIATQELGSEAEWSLEEKRSKIAEMLKAQEQRYCFVKLDSAKTQHLSLPLLRGFHLMPQEIEDYKRAVYEQQSAIPAERVDKMLLESERRFLTIAAAGHIPEAEESQDAIKRPRRRKSPLDKVIGPE
jgi:hypothetical protein